MSRFEDARKRIGRSVIHATEFMGEFRRLFPQDGRYDVRLDKEDERTWVARAVYNRDFNNSLALELGEFFYQLRAALDAAMWKAVTISEGPEPTAHADSLEFPIYNGKDPEDKFKKAAFHKFKIPDELKAWLGTIQPYSAPKPVNHPDCGLSVTLERLHDCARKDRHRKLHVAAAVAQRVEYDFIDLPPGLRLSFVEPVAVDFLKGEDIFLRFGIDGAIIGEEFPGKPKLATALQIDVSVDEIPVWSNEGFWLELRRFGEATEYIINRFDAFYDKLP